MAVKERLIEYVRYKELSKSEFCRIIGVSNAFISSIRKSIQPDKIESIALNFPELNLTWLLTGQGQMLNFNERKSDANKESNGVVVPTELFDILNKLTDTVLSQQRTIETLTRKEK